MRSEQPQVGMDAHRLRLMIVDDDGMQSGLFSELGAGAGYETLVVNDASHAVERAGVFKPDVMIIDLLMPGTDGVQLLRGLGAARCRTRILIVSGADARTLAAAKRLGEGFGLDVQAALSKSDALPAVRTALDQARARVGHGVNADALSAAIRENQLVLHYQPQIAIHRRKAASVDCVEALVRWNHPDRGILAPGVFLPLAEAEGLIGPLTEWVIDAAARQAALWARAGTDIAVAVNLPASTIADLSFPDHIVDVLSVHGVAPDRFVLEVTEHEALTDAMGSLDVLTRLRLRGFSLSIDDFGCGYSTLSTLHRMPFNELKIDRSLVAVVVHDREAEIVTRTILGLARRMGLSVCAEGVEDRATFDAMAKWGCNKIQGYFVGRPTPSENLTFEQPLW